MVSRSLEPPTHDLLATLRFEQELAARERKRTIGGRLGGRLAVKSSVTVTLKLQLQGPPKVDRPLLHPLVQLLELGTNDTNAIVS